MSNNQKIKFKKRQITKDQTAFKQKLNESIKNKTISHILALRANIELEKDFSQKNLFHYNLLSDLNIAADRLKLAILNKESICIVADYDADGATSCAIAFRGLKALGANVCFYVPNRFTDGYGLSESIVKKVISSYNPNLILTVDNGITSFLGVELANDYKIDCIITDHHIGGEHVPKAFAIVNPNKIGCSFPSKNLAGCGVIYYLICALRDLMIESIGEGTSKFINSLIDFVAIGTIADVVKLDKNNRILINSGMNRIRAGKSFFGIYSLLEKVNKNYRYLTCQDLAFSFAPKINAAGRLEDMSTGIKLLISDSQDDCIILSNKLVSLNKERVHIQEDMLNTLYDGSSVFMNGKFSVVGFSDKFHEGVIGIVASKIKEFYVKPAFIFAQSQENDEIKCSARSITGIHLKDLLDELSLHSPNLLIKYGGHSMAAGLTIKRDNIELFTDKIEYLLSKKDLPNEIFENILFYDEEIKISDIDQEIISFCENGIWGQGYEEPLFMSNVILNNITVVADSHSKFVFEDNGNLFDGIIFNKIFEREVIGRNAKIFYTISINRFNGNNKTQLMIKDIELNL